MQVKITLSIVYMVLMLLIKKFNFKFYIGLLFVILSSKFIFAHQPDIASTILSQQKNGSWVLQLRGSLLALQQQVRYHYSDTAYTNIEEFKSLTLDYIQKNVSVIANGKKIDLGKPIFRLGHETNIVFQLKGMPASIDRFTVINSILKDFNKNRNILVVLKEHFQKTQFILSRENNHTVSFLLDNFEFRLVKPSIFNYWYVGFFIIVLFVVSFLFFRLKSG